MSLELNPVFEAPGLQLGPVFNVAGVPAIDSITPSDTSVTFTYSGPATHRRVYALAGVAGSWVSIGASPVTITGLAANTEYTLEISANGSTVADSENFGTTNPGGGGGPISLTGSNTLNVGYGVGSAAFNFANVGYVVRSAGFNALDAGYEVISLILSGSATLSTGYAVVGTGSNTSSVGYAVAAMGLGSLDAGYSVAGLSGSATLTVGYAVRSVQQAALDVGYLVTFTGSRTLATGYLVESAGISTSNIKMTLRPRISITLKN